MKIQKCLVRAVSGMALAGAGALALGATTPAGAEGITSARIAEGGPVHGDPEWCYRIGSKTLCIAPPGPESPTGPSNSPGR
jgi:hypothetical protein